MPRQLKPKRIVDLTKVQDLSNNCSIVSSTSNKPKRKSNTFNIECTPSRFFDANLGYPTWWLNGKFYDWVSRQVKPFALVDSNFLDNKWEQYLLIIERRNNKKEK